MKIVVTAQKYMQEWEKQNNPFYPNEMRWDRETINNMLLEYDEIAKDLFAVAMLEKEELDNCYILGSNPPIESLYDKNSDMKKQIENILIKVDIGTLPVQQALIETLFLFNVSELMPSIDSLDDENSEINKIGREVAEMTDEEFENNSNELDMWIKSLRSKRSNRK